MFPTVTFDRHDSLFESVGEPDRHRYNTDTENEAQPDNALDYGSIELIPIPIDEPHETLATVSRLC